MMPIYTRALSTAEYGTVDLIQQISNLLVPIVTLGVTNALIRFGLDKSFRKNDVFTTGMFSRRILIIAMFFASHSYDISYLRSYGNALFFCINVCNA